MVFTISRSFDIILVGLHKVMAITPTLLYTLAAQFQSPISYMSCGAHTLDVYHGRRSYTESFRYGNLLVHSLAARFSVVHVVVDVRSAGQT